MSVAIGGIMTAAVDMTTPGRWLQLFGVCLCYGCALSPLRELDLQFNFLTGTIPEGISALSSLQ